MTQHTATAPTSNSTANVALGLSLAAIAVWISASAADVLYAVFPVPALAGVILGWKAGEGDRPRGRALAAVIIGGHKAIARAREAGLGRDGPDTQS